jgi:hypothetical protein
LPSGNLAPSTSARTVSGAFSYIARVHATPLNRSAVDWADAERPCQVSRAELRFVMLPDGEGQCCVFPDVDVFSNERLGHFAHVAVLFLEDPNSRSNSFAGTVQRGTCRRPTGFRCSSCGSRMTGCRTCWSG